MRLERLLAAVVMALMALWAVGFTVAVLRDNQVPGDMAVGAVVAAVLLPVFFAACVLGLLFLPLVCERDKHRDHDKPATNER